MKKIPDTDSVIVLRTDFSNEKTWKFICKELLTPHTELGFLPNIKFCNDAAYDGLSLEKLPLILSHEYLKWQGIIFIVDAKTISHFENPLLFVGIEDKMRTFRVIPSEVWSVENNLSMANMDFEEFTAHLDADGIFRGFQ